MEKDLKVLIKRAGQPEPTVETIKSGFRSLQAVVGGFIEMPYNFSFSEGLQVVCNEEGKLVDDAKPNVKWRDCDILFGDIVFVGIDDSGKTISLTDEQIAEAKKWIEENDASNFNAKPEEFAEISIRSFDNDEDFLAALGWRDVEIEEDEGEEDEDEDEEDEDEEDDEEEDEEEVL
jgi:hypothetical protein